MRDTRSEPAAKPGKRQPLQERVQQPAVVADDAAQLPQLKRRRTLLPTPEAGESDVLGTALEGKFCWICGCLSSRYRADM